MRAARAGAWLLALIAATGAAAAPPPLPAALAAGIRELDCANVTAAGVRDVLSRAPAPRIVLLQGSVPLVTMDRSPAS